MCGTRGARRSRCSICGCWRFPTFRIGVTGGTLTRMGIGALPFLLPFMLQLGFGYSPIVSGLLTFASAAGAMTNRVAATYIIRRFGYRNTLLFNAFLTSVLLGVNALWRPGTPLLLIFIVLLFGGFFRSLQFSAVNTLGYSDVPASQMSRATPFASMAQQLAMSLGIGTGALLLHTTLLVRGHSRARPERFHPGLHRRRADLVPGVADLHEAVAGCGAGDDRRRAPRRGSGRPPAQRAARRPFAVAKKIAAVSDDHRAAKPDAAADAEPGLIDAEAREHRSGDRAEIGGHAHRAHHRADAALRRGIGGIRRDERGRDAHAGADEDREHPEHRFAMRESEHAERGEDDDRRSDHGRGCGRSGAPGSR